MNNIIKKLLMFCIFAVITMQACENRNRFIKKTLSKARAIHCIDDAREFAQAEMISPIMVDACPIELSDLAEDYYDVCYERDTARVEKETLILQFCKLQNDYDVALEQAQDQALQLKSIKRKNKKLEELLSIKEATIVSCMAKLQAYEQANQNSAMQERKIHSSIKRSRKL